MREIEIPVVSVSETPTKLPEYTYSTDACFDLAASEEVTIYPCSRAAVKLGIVSGIPEGFAVELVPRSGLALNYGITVLNSPGQIDAGFRGIWKAILYNTSDTPFKIKPGDRICQGKLVEVIRAKFKQVIYLPASLRGNHGTGSSGIE